MLTYEEAKKIAYTRLLEIKGQQYLIDNKENFYTCWGNSGEVCEISILLSDGNDDSIFDNEGNIVVDETKKPEAVFNFEVNLNTGECKYIQ